MQRQRVAQYELRLVEGALPVEDDAEVAVIGRHAFPVAELLVQRDRCAVKFLRAFEIAGGLKGLGQIAINVC